MPMLSRSCMASTFSWWWSLSSCFCANLWISLYTTSTSRSLWGSLFLMYQGALTMFPNTLFWNCCIMSILLCLVQIWYRMSKRVLIFVCIEEVCYEGTVRSPFLSANTFFLYLRLSSSRFFLTRAFHRSLASKFMPRYLAVLAYGTFWLLIVTGCVRSVCW